jgi:glycosyltransferase involved in cell wall biosynthesis
LLPLRLADYWWRSRQKVQQADLIYTHTVDLPLAESAAPRVTKVVGDRAWERCIERGWIAPTVDIDNFQQADMGWWVERIKQSRARQVRAHDGVIVPSDYLKRMVCGWGVPESRVHVIYNAVPPLPQNTLYDSQNAARNALNWSDTPTVITVARLAPWKGIDHLITALQHVPGVRLLVVGSGDDDSRLKRLTGSLSLDERVQFTGRVPRSDVYQMMQAADYVALYSGYEGLPHTLLEALRAGTPVIASDKGGNPEVVQHGVNGLLVPYVDVDALSHTLQEAFSGQMRQRLADNTSRGLQRFTFERMVTQTNEVLRRYVSRSNATSE